MLWAGCGFWKLMVGKEGGSEVNQTRFLAKKTANNEADFCCSVTHWAAGVPASENLSNLLENRKTLQENRR